MTSFFGHLCDLSTRSKYLLQVLIRYLITPQAPSQNTWENTFHVKFPKLGRKSQTRFQNSEIFTNLIPLSVGFSKMAAISGKEDSFRSHFRRRSDVTHMTSMWRHTSDVKMTSQSDLKPTSDSRRPIDVSLWSLMWRHFRDVTTTSQWRRKL